MDLSNKQLKLSLVLGLLIATTSAPSVFAGEEKCNGKSATVAGSEGTEGDDVIIEAGGGTVRGKGGDDTICMTNYPEDGDSGSSRIFAGPGEDWVYAKGGSGGYFATVDGGRGRDVLRGFIDVETGFRGGKGADTYVGGDFYIVLDDVGAVQVDFVADRAKTEFGTDDFSGAFDAVQGGPEADVFVGTKGPQLVLGGGGADVISGGRGTDRLDGGSGRDLIKADRGHDYVFGGLGTNEVRGNDGIDNLWSGGDSLLGWRFPFAQGPIRKIEKGLYVNLDERRAKFQDSVSKLSSIEDVTGGDGEDLIIGNARANELTGNFAWEKNGDRVFGYGGDDVLRGDRVMNGGDGTDWCRGSAQTEKNCEK